MEDSEYIQDESETVDLVVWEEYRDWVRMVKEEGKSYQKNQDQICGSSQRSIDNQ